jgi:hypothetical protein
LKKFRKGAMHYFFLSLFLSFSIFAQENPIFKLNYSENILKRVDKGELISSAVVEFDEGKKIQSFKVFGLGYHKRNCKTAMRKISVYENFPNYLSIINKSSYDENKKIANFQISPPILSKDIDVYIKIERIKDQGHYPFKFVSGFFTALDGSIDLTDFENRCLFHVSASWSGPYSDVPSPILKLFLEAIIKMGFDNLFRVST